MKVLSVISRGPNGRAMVTVRDQNGQIVTRHVQRESDGLSLWRPTKAKWSFNKEQGFWVKDITPRTRVAKNPQTGEPMIDPVSEMFVREPIHEVYSSA